MPTQLSQDDTMMEYLEHTGSGLWAAPAGCEPGPYIDQSMFT